MDQQKIDQLFREKLDNFEVTPTAQSWGEVEKSIGTKRNPARFYLVAATLSAIILAWIVWPSQNLEKLTPIASEIDHPTLNVDPECAIPFVEADSEEENSTPVQVKQPPIQLAAQESIEEVKIEEIEEAPQIDLEVETVVAVESEDTSVFDESNDITIEEPVDSKIKIDLAKVKITYIAANETEVSQKKDSVGTLKKFISFAGKISPGNVLANIKTAKDDFTNGGFKSKQKDKRSL